MIYLLLLFIILVIIYSIYKERNLYNPLCIFFGVWFVIVLFNIIKLYDMIGYSKKSIILIFCGLLFFFLGFIFSNKKKNNNKNYMIDKYNNKFIRFLLIVGVLMTTALTIKVIRYLDYGVNYSNIRSMYYGFYNSQTLINNGKLFALFDIFSNSILLVSIPIVILSIFDKKTDKISVVLLVIMLLEFVFATAGRVYLLHVILEVIIVFLARYNSIAKSTRKKIVYCIIGVCAAVVLVTIFRNGIKTDEVSNTYAYFTIPMPLFSYYVDYVDKNGIILYGYSTFYGIYLLVQKALVVILGFKLPNADYLSQILNIPGKNWLKVFTETKTTYNAFSTMFFYFYLDFKIYGIILFSFIYGFVVTKIYNKIFNNSRSFIIYLLLSIGLFLSFVKFQFSSYYIYIALLILPFLVKKNVKDNSNQNEVDFTKMKSKGLKVSAIITTHNRLKYLKKAISSIKSQTYKNIEIIVVDDGSTDKTKDYCLKQKNIKYVFIPKKEHINGNYARNVGFNESSGEYIAFLDDDDAWLDSKIEKQVKIIETNKDIGAVYCGSLIEVNDGLFNIDNPVNIELHGDCSKKSFYNIIASTSSILFRREALVKVGLFDEKLNYWQDNEMLISISQKYKIEYVNEELMIYRELINDSKKISNNIDGFKEAVEYINKKYQHQISKLSKKEKKLRNYMIYNDIANRYVKTNNYKMCRAYLFKAFCEKPSLKTFVKVILNYTNARKIRLKIKY